VIILTDQDGNKEGASDIDVSSEINREEKRASFSASAPAEAEEKLRSELQKKEQAARESHDRYLRTLADFENYKKRAQKEQMEQAKFANEKLIKEFLPVIDNLDRALAHSKETKDFEKMVEGVELIQKQLLSTLAKFGVRPIESLNQPFDPFLHQSIGQVESDRSDEKEDQVVGETQKGYFLNERVLRPSLVLVSKKKSPSGDGNGPSEK
jgi:molecular chaperone GrpE